MTKKEAIEVMNRVRGMLMHLAMLAGDETKQAVQRTLCDLGDIEDLLGLDEVHSDNEDDEEE